MSSEADRSSDCLKLESQDVLSFSASTLTHSADEETKAPNVRRSGSC